MKNQYFSMVCIESFITFSPIIITYKTFSQKNYKFWDRAICALFLGLVDQKMAWSQNL